MSGNLEVSIYLRTLERVSLGPDQSILCRSDDDDLLVVRPTILYFQCGSVSNILDALLYFSGLTFLCVILVEPPKLSRCIYIARSLP